MYSYSETEHKITIYSAYPSTICPELINAPAITLQRDSFLVHAKYDLKQGYSIAQTVQTLDQIVEVNTIYGNLLPSPFLLINCAFNDEISGLQRPFSEYRGTWKLYRIAVSRSKCVLRFAHTPSLAENRRSIVELIIPCASIKFQCRIQFPLSKKNKCEVYKCSFIPHDTPDNHAPIEIGIRSYSNYPNKRTCKESFNCAYTIRDYLE